MYKNQLQELAQRSCFNLPSYTCIREGPDHAPRFKAVVNFNGDTFESPHHCTTLRQAEHAAAEVALCSFSSRGPSNSLAARILDDTGIYKNLLQEVSQRVGGSLPIYKTSQSGPGHQPVFTCSVRLAGITFTGEPARNRKQAEKNAAMAAWSSLKQLVQQFESLSPEMVNNDEQEYMTIARALQNYCKKAQMENSSFPITFPMPKPRPPTIQPSPITASKLLPLIRPKSAPQFRPFTTKTNDSAPLPSKPPSLESYGVRPQKFTAAGATLYIPVRHFRVCHGIAPPVTIRNAIPVFSAPPLPPLPGQSPQVRSPSLSIAPPVCMRPAVPASAAPPSQLTEPLVLMAPTIIPQMAPTIPQASSTAPPSQLTEPPVLVAPAIPQMAPTIPQASSTSQMEEIGYST